VAPVRVGGGVKAPTRLKYVAPEYPSLAVRAHVSGVVVVDAVLSPDGDVTGAKILRSIAMLDDAALAAVRQWVYTPTLLGGVPVPVEMTVTVTFNLTS
jgi:protein TonB